MYTGKLGGAVAQLSSASLQATRPPAKLGALSVLQVAVLPAGRPPLWLISKRGGSGGRALFQGDPAEDVPREEGPEPGVPPGTTQGSTEPREEYCSS